MYRNNNSLNNNSSGNSVQNLHGGGGSTSNSMDPSILSKQVLNKVTRDQYLEHRNKLSNDFETKSQGSTDILVKEKSEFDTRQSSISLNNSQSFTYKNEYRPRENLVQAPPVAERYGGSSIERQQQQQQQQQHQHTQPQQINNRNVENLTPYRSNNHY